MAGDRGIGPLVLQVAVGGLMPREESIEVVLFATGHKASHSDNDRGALAE